MSPSIIPVLLRHHRYASCWPRSDNGKKRLLIPLTDALPLNTCDNSPHRFFYYWCYNVA